MILAGIDEAGYGPVLGPLVVGCCAFELTDVSAGASEGEVLPCLWRRLHRLVSKTRSRSGRKIHVNDSKQVYSTGPGGLKELERAILAIAQTRFGEWTDFNSLLGHVADSVLKDAVAYRWYDATPDEKFPIECDGLSLRLFAKSLKVEMERSQTRCIHLAARVILEKELNKLFDATRNKSSVLFSTAAIHLDHLIRHYGDRNLVIFCDRQGGRAHYGALLRMMFDDWSLQILRESDGYSEYALLKRQNRVRIIFCEKAEAQCLPVAAASMISKYLREALMHRFNAFWKSHLPDVAPTAGYYTDGNRFLRDIQSKRTELGIADEWLVRSR